MSDSGLLYAPVMLEKFRPWYERWFTRLDGQWQPGVKWVTVKTGRLAHVQMSRGGLEFTIDSLGPNESVRIPLDDAQP